MTEKELKAALRALEKAGMIKRTRDGNTERFTPTKLLRRKRNVQATVGK